MIQLPATALEFGALNRVPSAAVSRTIMVAELSLLLGAVELCAPAEDYKRAAVDANALLKPTLESRRKSYACLRDRYALDSQVPLFRALRRLAVLDLESLPQIAILVAAMRDPLIRASFTLMLERMPGDLVSTPDFSDAIETVFPHQFSAKTLKAAAERVRASWSQSGFLTGPSSRRVRTNAPVTPASIAMGLMIGDACGLGGESLLSSDWIAIQGATTSEARAHAHTAARRGWIELRDAGGVLDITFRSLLSTENRPG